MPIRPAYLSSRDAYTSSAGVALAVGAILPHSYVPSVGRFSCLSLAPRLGNALTRDAGLDVGHEFVPPVAAVRVNGARIAVRCSVSAPMGVGVFQKIKLMICRSFHAFESGAWSPRSHGKIGREYGNVGRICGR